MPEKPNKRRKRKENQNLKRKKEEKRGDSLLKSPLDSFSTNYSQSLIKPSIISLKRASLFSLSHALKKKGK